jgi:hypothetical protein
MGDPAQLLIFLVIIVLSILLLVVGVQLFIVLRDFRSTLGKANRILDNAEEITHSISAPVSSISSIITSIKAGSIIAKILKKADLLEELKK